MVLSLPEISIVVPEETPIFESVAMTTWSRFASMSKRIRYDGTPLDYRMYVSAIASALNPTISVTIPTAMLPGVDLALPPSHAMEVVSNYIYQSRKKNIHYLSRDLVQALLGTDLKWIEAAYFDQLPEAITLRISANDALSVFVEGERFPVTDLLLYRVTNPEQVAMVAKDFPNVAPGRIFGYHAVSRVKASDGVMYATWGSFPVREDMKLDDLLSGLGAWAVDTQKQSLQLAEDRGVVAHSNIPGELGEQQERYFGRINSEFLEDMAKHGAEHRDASLGVVAFIAKYVLLMASEGWSEFAKPIVAPGVKAKAKMSKKAREIQERVRARWGYRLKVSIPPIVEVQDDSADAQEAGGHHSSPVRHLVRGFFRQQAHGPLRSMRKTIWVAPFWRGKFLLKNGSR